MNSRRGGSSGVDENKLIAVRFYGHSA